MGNSDQPSPRQPYSPPTGYMPPPPPPRDNSGRAIFWVLVGTATGFMLPFCACAFICVFSFAALTSLVDNVTDEGSGPAIGIVELQGVMSTGSGFGATTEHFQKQLDYMAENKDVKAIVIRANSPGGGVHASDEMWYAIKRFKQETGKPVVVYMQSMCASGCLYASSSSDELFANRSALVGSIGVISTFFNFQELLDDIGVEPQVIATGENKDFGSFYRPLTEEEEAYWRSQINIVLENFIDVVANRDGSTLTVDEVRELANGRVWVAPEALNLGLIDQIGYEDDAIAYAASLANISNYRIVEYPFNFSVADILSASANLGELNGYFDLPNAGDLLDSLQQPPLQYRYMGPYEQSR
ncbi:MAG: signal peptide peptidase SppA [Phototrophicales bacterium]|nr:MAG: signal peptide peptidase SppA [Phototrophicales bacterium]